MLSQLLESTSRSRPEDLAVICGDHTFTYDGLRKRVFTQANEFLVAGIEPGDRVAILHKNCHRYLESYFAAALAGCVLVPINYRLAPKDIAYILKDSGAKILIAQQDFAETVLPAIDDLKRPPTVVWSSQHDAACPVVDKFAGFIANTGFANMPGSSLPPDAPAHIYYTSGTTGKPKGVVLTHRNNESHTRGVIKELELTKDDRWLHISPMFHLADAWAVWAVTSVGGVHVMLPEFTPETSFQAIEGHQVSLSNFIPTLLNLMVKDPKVDDHDYSSLRLILSGGAPIAPEVVRSVIEHFGCDYIQTYGLTETSPFLTMSILHDHLKDLPEEERLKYMVTTGRPFADVDVKVVDGNGQDVAADDSQVGEIIAKGDTITHRYWNLPEVTKEKIIDGWLHTGDLATVNSEGYVTIVDRKDDMIITGGENVYSIEVENVLYSHPSVLEAAVIGVPDETWGEAITGIVVVKPGEEKNEKRLLEHCKNELAGFKVPKRIYFQKELTKTGSGKVYKKMLRDLYTK